MAKSRADADTYVMLGDDYEADIVGAREAGFVPIYLDSEAAAAAQIRDLGVLSTVFDVFA